MTIGQQALTVMLLLAAPLLLTSLVVGLLIGGSLSLLFVSRGQTSPFIGIMLAVLSAAGVFFLFACAFGARIAAGAGAFALHNGRTLR